MDKQSYLLPVLLLAAGVVGALYVLFLVFSPFDVEYVVWFAFSCLVAALGWAELKATDDFNQSFESE